MEKRIVEFIRALRAAGVRISLAESQDALRAVDVVGALERDYFRSTLRTTTVKDAGDQRLFDTFFPLFFGANTPPMQDIPGGLSPDERQMLQQALQALEGSPEALRELLRQLLEGQPFDGQQLDQMGQQAGLPQGNRMYQREWFERRMWRQAGLQKIRALIEELLNELQQMGMSEEAIEQLREMLMENAEGLAGQMANYVGMTLAQQMAEREPQPKPDLMDVPFSHLGMEEVEQIRDEIRRLAARLRSRAALRQKRAKAGKPDPRKVMRANMRYGGVPLELKFQTRHVKPSLVLVCDVSTSMRYCAEFLLTLIYELQDQVARTNSFVFIDDLTDISMIFEEHEPRDAVERVLAENRPGYYNTDLGNSLVTFQQDYMPLVTGKTTVILLGDGRNNFNDPRIEITQEMQRRSRRLLWFNPEPPAQWGTGDSDMLLYAPLADGVFRVSNLRELAAAVDQILADG